MIESQNRDLWFTLPPQRSLLVSWLLSAIPIPILKFPISIHLVCALFINPVIDHGFLLLIMKTVVNSVILHLHNNAVNISVKETFQSTFL